MTAQRAITGDRYPVTVERNRLDGEERIALHLNDTEIPWARVCVRIFVSEEGGVALHAAFGIDALTVALAEDIAPQEAANTVMATALGDVCGADAGLLRTMLDDAWDRTLDRLERRWTEIAKKKPNPDALCLWHYKAKGGPALIGRTTQLGTDEPFGVCRAEVEYGHLRSYGSVVLPTREMLTKMTTLSGHEKLDIMSVKGREYSRARDVFDQRRRGNIRRNLVWPMRDRDMQGFSTDDRTGGSILMTNGNSGKISTARSYPQVICTLKQNRYDIIVDRKDDGPLKINRFRGKDERFKSPELLDAALRRVIAMLLAWDEPLPDWFVSDDAAPFDPAHPVLAGIDIPPRHRAFVGAMLGAPYAKAKKRAVAKAAKLAKEAAKVEGVSTLPDQLADGTIVGVQGQTLNRYGGLHMVMTDPLSEARRRRCITNINVPGYESFPLTPKHLAHMPKLEDPDALRLMVDDLLQVDKRDVIEGAFRLSFALEPKARNPLLETKARIEIVEDLPGMERMRITDHPGADGCALLALAVVSLHPDTREHYAKTSTPNRDQLTGAALMMLTVFGEQRFYLRPSNVNGTISLPPEHRTTIEAGIGRLCDLGRIGADEAMALRGGLATEWTTLSKEYGA